MEYGRGWSMAHAPGQQQRISQLTPADVTNIMQGCAENQILVRIRFLRNLTVQKLDIS